MIDVNLVDLLGLVSQIDEIIIATSTLAATEVEEHHDWEAQAAVRRYLRNACCAKVEH